ncbi:MAG: hypothetical protein LBG71_00720 [Clostridiales Family XIII bacterium]|jgi:hypothetical protein|nr:hypothetical protein [Clostridiales Family XIII bacterium]
MIRSKTMALGLAAILALVAAAPQTAFAASLETKVEVAGSIAAATVKPPVNPPGGGDGGGSGNGVDPEDKGDKDGGDKDGGDKDGGDNGDKDGGNTGGGDGNGNGGTDSGSGSGNGTDPGAVAPTEPEEPKEENKVEEEEELDSGITEAALVDVALPVGATGCWSEPDAPKKLTSDEQRIENMSEETPLRVTLERVTPQTAQIPPSVMLSLTGDLRQEAVGRPVIGKNFSGEGYANSAPYSRILTTATDLSGGHTWRYKYEGTWDGDLEEGAEAIYLRLNMTLRFDAAL